MKRLALLMLLAPTLSWAVTTAPFVQMVDKNGQAFTVANPFSVVVSSQSGVGVTPVIDPKEVLALAASSTDNHDYTSVGSVFRIKQILASSSGLMKAELFVNGVSKAVFFNGGASYPMVEFDPKVNMDVPVGQVVRVTLTNREAQPVNVYSTIIGEQQ